MYQCSFFLSDEICCCSMCVCVCVCVLCISFPLCFLFYFHFLPVHVLRVQFSTTVCRERESVCVTLSERDHREESDRGLLIRMENI